MSTVIFTFDPKHLKTGVDGVVNLGTIDWLEPWIPIVSNLDGGIAFDGCRLRNLLIEDSLFRFLGTGHPYPQVPHIGVGGNLGKVGRQLIRTNEAPGPVQRLTGKPPA